MKARGWLAEEHVLAGPFRDLLRRACDEPKVVPKGGYRAQTRHFEKDCADTQLTTSRNEYERRYAERYGVTQRTAARHFTLALSQPTIPVVIADRISALLGQPFAYIEAVG